MNKGTIGILSFIAGGGVGIWIGKKLLEQQYAQLAQEEIESVKEVFLKQNEDKKKDTASLKPSEKDTQVTEEVKKKYVHYAKQYGYTQEETPAPVLKPRVISPDEFEDQEGYDSVTLTYYADGTLTDSNEKPMDDDLIEEYVGKESLTHFGEYEDDSVHVRNDRLKTDFEILLDPRTYAAILKEKPYLAN